MKSARIVLSLTALCFSISASAALAPYWERAKELATIAQDDGVATAMNGHGIEAIRYVATDEYEISGSSCTVTVALETIPPPPHVIGARRFTVNVTRQTGCR